jgi:hypothetical protein
MIVISFSPTAWLKITHMSYWDFITSRMLGVYLPGILSASANKSSFQRSLTRQKMSEVALCGINLRSGGAKAKVNRGGSNSLIWTWTLVRAIFSCLMSSLILGLGDDFDAGRPLGVPASITHSPTAVVPQSRSAPGKVASLLLVSVR